MGQSGSAGGENAGADERSEDAAGARDWGCGCEGCEPCGSPDRTGHTPKQ